MTLFQPLLKRVVVIFVITLLVSCGGGGSTGTGNSASPVTYSLGGVISYLLTSGLVLSDGTGRTASLSPNTGSFSFNSGNPYLAAGTQYNVTVQTQPAGMKCGVTNGTGSITGNNLNQILVDCVAPSVAPVNSTYPTGLPCSGFDFAVMTNGKFIVSFGCRLFSIDPTAQNPGMTPLVIQNGLGGPDIQATETVWSIAVDPISGAIYAAATVFGDTGCTSGYCKIQQLMPTGTAGTYVATAFAGSTTGFAEGSGANAQFGRIQGLALDGNGNLYVADGGNNRIRKVDSSGNVTTLAGSGSQATQDGNGTGASFDMSFGGVQHSLTIDGSGNLYLAQNDITKSVRKISSSGGVSTFATGRAVSAITSDTAGNVYTAEFSGSAGYETIVKTTSTGSASTLVEHGVVKLPGLWAADMALGHVICLAIDGNGDMYAGANGAVMKIAFP